MVVWSLSQLSSCDSVIFAMIFSAAGMIACVWPYRSFLAVLAWQTLCYDLLLSGAQENIFFYHCIAQGKTGFPAKKDWYFSYFSVKTYIVGTLWNCFNEWLLLSTCQVFCREISYISFVWIPLSYRVMPYYQLICETGRPFILLRFRMSEH